MGELQARCVGEQRSVKSFSSKPIAHQRNFQRPLRFRSIFQGNLAWNQDSTKAKIACIGRWRYLFSCSTTIFCLRLPTNERGMNLPRLTVFRCSPFAVLAL